MLNFSKNKCKKRNKYLITNNDSKGAFSLNKALFSINRNKSATTC